MISCGESTSKMIIIGIALNFLKTVLPIIILTIGIVRFRKIKIKGIIVRIVISIFIFFLPSFIIASGYDIVRNNNYGFTGTYSGTAGKEHSLVNDIFVNCRQCVEQPSTCK